ILTDGGPKCLPAPWDATDPVTFEPGYVAPDADFETRTNLGVTFLPQEPVDPDGERNTRPCMTVGTVQVYAYREDGRLIVSVDTDGVDSTGESDETDADGNVPMEITINGNDVYTS
ncbi:hypothetical protein, partial [Streptomyces sp. NPDC056670]|uniref:hypothetical protein n=1 Tax=Streptomyces sp. NPDC056670 TaxID=3345904 RepID=UPI0036C42876